MDWKIFGMTFMVVFFAEVGDKTQLSVLSLSASTQKPYLVALAAAIALALGSLIAALVGQGLYELIPARMIQKTSAVIFILIGLWVFFKGHI